MLTVNEKKLLQFKEALRAYESCRPFCLPADDQQGRLACFEQCSKKHKELADKLKVTLQYNIE